MWKQATNRQDVRIPEGMAVREYDQDTVGAVSQVRDGFRWVARHEDINHSCDWCGWSKTYAGAVLAARGHVLTGCGKSRKGRIR